MSATTRTKKVTAPTDTQPVPPPYVAPDSASPSLSGQRNYLAMMLLAYSLIPTGLARLYIGDKSGKTRVIIFIIACVAMIIPVLNLAAGLVLFVLEIWGIVDIFLLRSRKTDASGRTLAATAWDRKWEKGLFIATIIGFVLTILAIISIIVITIVFGVSAFQEYSDYMQGSQHMQQEQQMQPSRHHSTGRSFDY